MSSKSYMQSAEALGTVVELRLISSSKIRAEEYFSKIWDYVAEFEKRFSRFQEESEINLVNFNSNTKVKASSEFIELARESLRLSELTDGRYNPFVLPAVQRAGYLRSMKPGGERLKPIDFTDRSVVDWRELLVGSSYVRIPEDSALDFGGIGKGYLADKLADLVGEEFAGHLFSIGGDINCGGLDEDGECWFIDVQSYEDVKQKVAVFRADNSVNIGIATSGLWHSREGVNQAHIIDPHTRRPTDSLIAACTVVSSSAAYADVLASCVLIGGKEFAEEMIKLKYAESVLLQLKDGTVNNIGKTFNVQ